MDDKIIKKKNVNAYTKLTFYRLHLTTLIYAGNPPIYTLLIEISS
jgi:hypothetical protein